MRRQLVRPSLGMQCRGRVCLASEVCVEIGDHCLEGPKSLNHLLVMAPALYVGAGLDRPAHLDVDLPYAGQGGLTA
jgi:hypothetical protein